MTGFISKKIDKIETLGEILIKHRKERKLSIEKSAKDININSRYIRLLEKNKFSELPADVYTVNILKNYAEILNLNPNSVIERYKKEKDIYLKTQIEKKQAIKNSKILNLILNPQLLKYIVVLIIVGSIITYIGWGINKIISPPDLTILTPNDNLIIETHSIQISGKTEKEVDILINNRPVLIDTEGSFNIDIDLQNGLNIIKITAQKKHSKKNIIYRKIIVKNEES